MGRGCPTNYGIQKYKGNVKATGCTLKLSGKNHGIFNNAEENPVNMRESFVFISSINQFPRVLKRNLKETHHAQNEIVGISFFIMEIEHTSLKQTKVCLVSLLPG